MFAVLFKESRSCRLSPKARMGGTRSNSELNADLILLDVGLPELNDRCGKSNSRSRSSHKNTLLTQNNDTDIIRASFEQRWARLHAKG